MSLAQIRQPPDSGLILLVGPPGAGKSTLCHQVVLNSLAMDRPVIFVTTEQSPSAILGLLGERGLGTPVPGSLSFVDAFDETVGVQTAERPDTVHANCMNLNSISIAATRLQQRTSQTGTLLVFDSLTSPYLFGGREVVKFMRLFLSKFAAEGNSVVALVDEGCGRAEDLVAMMSVADGIVRMETEDGSRFVEVVKHPTVSPTRVEVPLTPSVGVEGHTPDPRMMRRFVQAMLRGDEAWVRREIGDFVNLLWPQLAHWSGMLWDPKGFPAMVYEANREDPRYMLTEGRASFPLQLRLIMRLAANDFSRVKDMKRASGLGLPYIKMAQFERSGIVEYLEDVSKTDEHHFRVYESADCWGLQGIGVRVASHLPPLFAGSYRGLERVDRGWNAVETKCIGVGDPYCEFKVVPGESQELRASLEKDPAAVGRIHERLMERLVGFLLHGSPLVERPRLGSDVQLHAVWHAMGSAMGGERYRMAQRMGGAKSGKELGERLLAAGLDKDEAVKRVIDFIQHCRVGRVTTRPGRSTLALSTSPETGGTGSGQAVNETIRIEGNCESLSMVSFLSKTQGPSCFFTTGFLNGLFSAVVKKHVREVKCMAAGDPYCEWEIV